MQKKILIVNQHSGYLTTDVANAFKCDYEQVVLMLGQHIQSGRSLHPSVHIQRTFRYNRATTVKRLWTWCVTAAHLFLLLCWKYRHHHVLYYTNPPLAYFNALVFKNPFGLVVFDVYPDSLKLSGIKEPWFIYRAWKWVNKKVFAKAQVIITLSEGMKQQLEQYVSGDKIRVVSIWPASENLKPIGKESNEFLKSHGWVNKFIVIYSGNMGAGHKLDVLIEAAYELQNHEDILFLFIGDGLKKDALFKKTMERCLYNVRFLPWQEPAILPNSLAAGDIAVVSLEPAATHASVPSKTFNYMAVGAPILAIGSPGSELEKLVLNHEIGFYTNGRDVAEIKSFILDLYHDRSKRDFLSKKSFAASKGYSYELANRYKF
jgi:glycosyltransferase involved in cell wall biosynthesis